MAHKTFIKNVTNSDTVVLFIHGFLGSTEHFESFIVHIPGHISVYNILLDGHGGSVADFGKTSMVKWQKQTEAVVDELKKKYRKIYIVAHSMGTFFAMDAAVKHPDFVQAVFLLQTPLKIGVKPSAVSNTLRSFFNMSDNDETAKAYKNAHSVELNLRVWEYIRWIPRYLELFKASKEARTTILNVNVPCLIFQSAKDELVSMKSVAYIPKKENISLNILEKSAHFIYDGKDAVYLNEMFLKMIGDSQEII